MKKLLAILLAAMMLFSLTACGAEQKEEKIDDVQNSSLSDSTDDSSNAETETKSDTSTGDYTWKDYLVDYENWVDEYISVLKKYHENPSDLSFYRIIVKWFKKRLNGQNVRRNLRQILKMQVKCLNFLPNY